METVIKVADVFELAAESGQEFEKLIESLGADAVVNLMPKVITSFEHLEKLACRNEKSLSYIEELQNTISQLRHEINVKLNDRRNFEKELEIIEGRFKERNHKLLQTATRLQAFFPAFFLHHAFLFHQC